MSKCRTKTDNHGTKGIVSDMHGKDAQSYLGPEFAVEHQTSQSLKEAIVSGCCTSTIIATTRTQTNRHHFVRDASRAVCVNNHGNSDGEDAEGLEGDHLHCIIMAVHGGEGLCL